MDENAQIVEVPSPPVRNQRGKDFELRQYVC
jgi:hypothetical protein